MNILSIFRRDDPELEADKIALKKVTDRLKQKVSLDWNFEDDDGHITMSLKGITDEWTEFVKGMSCKILDIHPHTAGTLIACHITEPFTMQKQWHFEGEAVLSLDLNMVDILTGHHVGPGSSIFWKSGEKHKPSFLDTGFILVYFTPALKN